MIHDDIDDDALAHDCALDRFLRLARYSDGVADIWGEACGAVDWRTDAIDWHQVLRVAKSLLPTGG